MNKLGAVLIIIAVIGACYLLLLPIMPVLVDFANTANSTIIDTGRDMAQYPGAVEFLVASPWILFFVPAVIGIVVVVLILRTRK